MRRNRIDLASESGVYHVYARGTEKRTIFMADSDYSRFLGRLTEYGAMFRLDVRCYCLLPNHFHLLVHSENIAALSSAMHRLLTSYSVYFNRKYGRTGHLFQGRFRSKPVETEAYYLQLVEYIRNNPVAITPPGNRYRWIGGGDFQGQAPAGAWPPRPQGSAIPAANRPVVPPSWRAEKNRSSS